MALSTPPAANLLTTTQESGVRVKAEKKDDQDDVAQEATPPAISRRQLSGLQARNVIVRNVAAAAASSQRERPAENKPVAEVKPKPPPIDKSSILGVFGWTTIGSLHLPFIMRGEDTFVPVRIVESKIMSVYASFLPQVIFQCTNIKSYYITENEATLLNEINSFHCDFAFGNHTFSVSDTAIRVADAEKFYEFLETCKAKLNVQGFNPVFSDQCGFFLINYAHVPYVKKGATKYISLHMVYSKDVPEPATKTETYDDWDLAYLKFLSYFVSEGEFHIFQKFKFNVALCSIDDLENALGGVRFEEVWPINEYSSKQSWSHLFSSTKVLRKWEAFLSCNKSTALSVDESKKLREKVNIMQDKESMFNSILGLTNLMDINSPLAKVSHISRKHEQLNSIQNSEKASIFPVALESFLASSSYNYPYPVNYHNQYNSHPSLLEYERYRKPEGGLPTSKSRSFPPPPPLVRMDKPKTSSSLYPYIASNSAASYPPWLTRMFEPDWLEDSRSDAPENLARRLSETDVWCRTALPTSNLSLNGAGSSGGNSIGYDLAHGSDLLLTSQDRMLTPHGGSPRLLSGPGPPPHYPTPPQSSPLQPLAFLESELYHQRAAVPADLCSPPPSPESRTTTTTTSSATTYHVPHVTRMVQVDSRYLVAINVEPLRYNSILAVPVSDVVNKFLRGATVQTCQMVLEGVFNLHLYECTGLHQEVFAKHNLPIMPGTKLISVTDLKNYLYQLKFYLAEHDKVSSGKHCDIRASELPSPAKRWCGSVKQC